MRFIRVCVFMISGLMAGLAAAVIGGTSLFGGRGRVAAALLGALVIATIGNGLSLIGSTAATQYITTGIILLAVSCSTRSRGAGLQHPVVERLGSG